MNRYITNVGGTTFWTDESGVDSEGRPTWEVVIEAHGQKWWSGDTGSTEEAALEYAAEIFKDTFRAVGPRS